MQGGRWKGQRQTLFRRRVPATGASCALLLGSAGPVRGGGLPFGEHHLESTALGIWECRSGPGEWDETHEEHTGRTQTMSVWPWARECPGQLEVRAKGTMSHKPEVTSARLGDCSQGPLGNTFFPKELQEERGEY